MLNDDRPFVSYFNTTMAKELLLRVFGYGIAALSSWIGFHLGGETMGKEVAGATAVIGTAVVNKAIPYIVPTKAKVEAANQMPKPLPARKGMPGT